MKKNSMASLKCRNSSLLSSAFLFFYEVIELRMESVAFLLSAGTKLEIVQLYEKKKNRLR